MNQKQDWKRNWFTKNKRSKIKGSKTKKSWRNYYNEKEKKEYLDNYQYHETKNLKDKKPAVVIHERLGDPVGGIVEEYSYQKTTLREGNAGKNRPGSRTTTTKTETKQNKSTSNVRSRIQPQDRATNRKTETTKVGRRSRPNQGSKTTTKTTTTTTRGGETKTQTRTTTKRGRK